jgi:hypothetical protein
MTAWCNKRREARQRQQLISLAVKEEACKRKFCQAHPNDKDYHDPNDILPKLSIPIVVANWRNSESVIERSTRPHV